ILQYAAEAEDVVGDVFQQVWGHIDQHDARRGPLVPWILSIARNRALDALRRRRRWWRKAERWERAREAAAEDVVGAHAPFEGSVVGWPLHREVHAALGALPEEQRRVVLLAYFEARVSALEDTLSLIRSPATRVVQIPVSTSGRVGAVTIFADTASHRWLVTCHGLSPNQPGQAYQIWFITEQGMKSAAVMSMDSP